MTKALKELLEKVEVETPRIGIDCDFEAAWPERHEHWDEDPAAHAINAYLGSLDAAKALHEALLPGWVVDRLMKWDDTARCWLLECREASDGRLWHRSRDLSVKVESDTMARHG